MYGLSSSNHDLAPANVQSVLTAMKIAVFRYNRLLIHQLSRPDVMQSTKNLAMLEMIYEELMIINSSASLISSFPSSFLHCFPLVYLYNSYCTVTDFLLYPVLQNSSVRFSLPLFQFIFLLTSLVSSPLSLFI